MPTVKYSDETKIDLVDAVDAGMSVAEAAAKFKVERNTAYTWTKKEGRKGIEAIRESVMNARRQKVVQAKFGAVVQPTESPKPATSITVNTPKVQASNGKSDRETRLERELDLAKKLIKAYKEMLGVDF